MKRAGTIAAVTIFFCMVITSTQAQNLTIEQRRNMRIQSMQFGGDTFLLSDRRVCAKQRIHAAKQEIEAKGTPFPEPEEFCLAVLEETAKRKRVSDLYASISPAHIDDLILRIVKASLRKQATIVSVNNMPLPCSLAFDAGFFYGVIKPNAKNRKSVEYGGNFTLLTRECYDPAKNVSSLNGLIAGVHAGQKWRKNHPQ